MNPQMSFEELDVVQLLLSLPTRHGPTVGTIGTIVSKYGDPDSDFVKVEFDAPWHVVTVAVTALAWIMHVRPFCATGTPCYQWVSDQVKVPIRTLLIRVC
jgi:hypothetical protein